MNAPAAFDKASAAWGDPAPAWIAALAQECDRTSANRAAVRVGISPSAVSQLLRNCYPGDLGAMERRVLGRLVGVSMECPVLGTITLDSCLDNQAAGVGTASPQRVRLGHACPVCPHRHEGVRHAE